MISAAIIAGSAKFISRELIHPERRSDISQMFNMIINGAENIQKMYLPIAGNEKREIRLTHKMLIHKAG